MEQQEAADERHHRTSGIPVLAVEDSKDLWQKVESYHAEEYSGGVAQKTVQPVFVLKAG